MGREESISSVDAPITCQVKIQGILDELWSGHLGGMSIRTEYDGNLHAVSILTGRLQDQAALTGILSSLHDLGYPLLSVEILST